MKDSTVLIVDDEPANLSVLSEVLRPYYQVRAAKSGEQALRVFEKKPFPDLVLLDVMMPEMDGYEVLSQLQENDETRRIPVIFVTALSDEVDEEHGLRLGAVDYIAKPIKPAIMLARVRAHLEIKHTRDRLRSQNDWLEAEVSRRMEENQVLEQVTLNVILGLAETRDSDTGDHIARTQGYVEALGRALQKHPSYATELTDENLTMIVKAAPLHDIGKIGIPDSILLKPGKLDADEWAVMQTHTTIGAAAIERALENNVAVGAAGSIPVLEIARVIAASHHERWDGSGYPAGLKGEEIPVAARLMALADVYDALTTPRVYKPAWSVEDTEKLILEERGKHFCPEVVDAFAEVRDDFRDIVARLADIVVE